MRLVVLGLVSLAVLAVAACGDTAGPKTTQSPSSQADRIDMVASDDAEMNAAITTAKQSFGRFLDAFLDPQPGQSAFEVKAVFVEGDNAEHLWLADLDLSDADHLKGTVANKPALLSLRFKQRVEFEPSRDHRLDVRAGRQARRRVYDTGAARQDVTAEASSLRCSLALPILSTADGGRVRVRGA